jgi:hypothetical protein
MRLTGNPKILIGSSVLLTTCAFLFAAMLTFDLYPLPIKVVLTLGLFLGTVLQIWGLYEKKRLTVSGNEKAANL